MKALYLLAPLGLVAGLTACSTTYTQPASVAIAPAYVAPAYVAPPTVVLGAGPSYLDSDGDGVPDYLDHYPYDPRFR